MDAYSVFEEHISVKEQCDRGSNPIIINNYKSSMKYYVCFPEDFSEGKSILSDQRRKRENINSVKFFERNLLN